MEYQLLQYRIWEQQHLKEHAELLAIYDSLKEKEANISEIIDDKYARKVQLLEQKEDNTISKAGDLELSFIDSESLIDKTFNSNKNVIVVKRDKLIQTAEYEYETALENAKKSRDNKIARAESEYERVLEYYETQKEQSFNKNKQVFDTKLKALKTKEEALGKEIELGPPKTAAALTISKQKYDILVKIRASINQMMMSRDSLTGREIKGLPPLPEMPEPLQARKKVRTVIKSKPVTQVEEPVTVTVNKNKKFCPCGNNCPIHPIHQMPECLCTEEAATIMMRKEAKAEDAKLRKEAEELEQERIQKQNQYRIDCEIRAEERRAENEKRRLENPEGEAEEKAETKETQEPDELSDQMSEIDEKELEEAIRKSEERTRIAREKREQELKERNDRLEQQPFPLVLNTKVLKKMKGRS